MEFKWTKTEQNTFDKIKQILARDNLLTYPDFNEWFKNHTDDSTLQLGEVITQKGNPINLYGRNLTYFQRRYKVTEKFLLSMIETKK